MSITSSWITKLSEALVCAVSLTCEILYFCLCTASPHERGLDQDKAGLSEEQETLSPLHFWLPKLILLSFLCRIYFVCWGISRVRSTLPVFSVTVLELRNKKCVNVKLGCSHRPILRVLRSIDFSPTLRLCSIEQSFAKLDLTETLVPHFRKSAVGNLKFFEDISSNPETAIRRKKEQMKACLQCRAYLISVWMKYSDGQSSKKKNSTLTPLVHITIFGKIA